MQSGVPSKPATPQYQAPPPGARSGNRACGCFAIGCGGSIVLLIGLCGLGYYLSVHTALPLRLMERAIEDSGDVEIEGLDGSFGSGFEVQKFRFKNDTLVERATGKPRWSELQDIKIKYRSGFFSSSFTIEEISVGGGTIYADIDLDNENGGDFVFNELQEELSNVRSEIGSGNGDGTFEVRLISISDLTIADTNSDTKFSIDEVRLDNVVIEDGRMVEFGELIVKADNVDVSTKESETLEGASLERTITGRLSKGLVASVLTDIPFEIQFGVMEAGKILTKSSWFDGKIKYDSAHGDHPARYVIEGFTPSEHFRPQEATVPISNIRLDVEYDLDNQLKISKLGTNGSFTIGQTSFTKFAIPEEVDGRTDLRVFSAEAEVSGRTVQSYVYILPRIPLLGVRLKEAGDWSLQDTWAQTVYGQPFSELKSDEQEKIETAISQGKKRFTSSVDSESEESPRSNRKRNRASQDGNQPADRATGSDNSGKAKEAPNDEPSDDSSKNSEDDGLARHFRTAGQVARSTTRLPKMESTPLEKRLAPQLST